MRVLQGFLSWGIPGEYARTCGMEGQAWHLHTWNNSWSHVTLKLHLGLTWRDLLSSHETEALTQSWGQDPGVAWEVTFLAM